MLSSKIMSRRRPDVPVGRLVADAHR